MHFRTISLLYLLLSLVDFIQGDLQQFNRSEVVKTKVKREKDSPCQNILFKLKNDTCIEEEVGISFPIRGNCTAYYKCAVASPTLFSREADTNCAAVGEIFDVQSKICSKSEIYNTTNCPQLACANATQNSKQRLPPTPPPPPEGSDSSVYVTNSTDEKSGKQIVYPDSEKDPHHDHKDHKEDKNSSSAGKILINFQCMVGVFTALILFRSF